MKYGLYDCQENRPTFQKAYTSLYSLCEFEQAICTYPLMHLDQSQYAGCRTCTIDSVKGSQLRAYCPYAIANCYVEFKLSYLKNFQIKELFDLFDCLINKKKWKVALACLFFVVDVLIWCLSQHISVKKKKKKKKKNIFIKNWGIWELFILFLLQQSRTAEC